MKIGIVSDLHLEFGDLLIHNNDDVDVLVLAGDICHAENLFMFREFFETISNEFKEIIYVLGNHEHYNNQYSKTHEHITQVLYDDWDLDNIVLLEDSWCPVDGVNFIGATLWTDMNDENPIDMRTAQWALSDFRCIKNNDGLFTPQHSADIHRESVRAIGSLIDAIGTGKIVVVTHHSPSYKGIDEKFLNSNLNACFHTNLDQWIEHSKIDLWIHGHIHDPVDYIIGDTRVVCNPRGYFGREPQSHKFKMKIIVI